MNLTIRRARPPLRAVRLGAVGHLGCLVFGLVVAVLARGWRIAIAALLVLALVAIFAPAGLKPLRSRRLWLFLAILLVPSGLIGGPADWTFAGVAWSRQGLAAGAQMAMRAIAIVVAVAGFAASVSVSEMARLLERGGVKGLGFALGVAVNMLPVVQETAANAWHALRLRGGFRRRRLRAARLLLITVVVNCLSHVDDIVGAAEARAFTADRPTTAPLEWRRGDLLLTGFLATAALVLLLV